jgi:hypothetical protein
VDRTSQRTDESTVDRFINEHRYLTALAIGLVVFAPLFVVQAWLLRLPDALSNAAIFASLLIVTTLMILRRTVDG